MMILFQYLVPEQEPCFINTCKQWHDIPALKAVQEYMTSEKDPANAMPLCLGKTSAVPL